jgi:hypothetical protein
MMHIALFVPALNEEAALQRTCGVMRAAVDAGVVSSAFVLDGGSTDGSAAVAASCGIDVLHVPSLMPLLGPVLGKGDSLFRAVHSVEADWYVFLDADLGNVSLDHVRALVVPGSGLVKKQAEAEGLDRILREAGFEWREAGCSMCLGMNPDKLTPGQRSASTSNRNFEGRQGPGGRTHLLSPAMAAAAALAGHLADVRDYQPKGAI